MLVADAPIASATTTAYMSRWSRWDERCIGEAGALSP
jgi:hypothetical protein